MSKRKFDFMLFFAVLGLVVIGLVFVYSASMYTAETTYGNKYFFLFKQLIGAVIGVVAMLAVSQIKLDFIKKLWIVGVVVAVVLLVLVFVPGISIENYGAKRWIGFGGFSMQPSEIAKFAFVLFCSVYMSRKDMSKFSNSLIVIIVGVIFCGLIIAEPNMSITMCMAMLLIIMLFLGGMKWRHFLLLLVPVILAVPVLIFMEPYRLQRLLAFIDPWASPKDEGYQLIQSLYALGSGGFFGVGIFNSRQKYRFLPFAESDFIFSVIGEETGLFGCAVVFALYIIVILRGVRIAANAKDKFRCYLAAGISAVIAVQSVLNFAVVTGSIPPTGLPLPFISYGGTSLVVFLAAVGILLNISRDVIPHKTGAGLWIT
ncbi:MAG: putative lipid II flippase FtsW [Corallococcus sp.]|nr:putative lipid II flippase FtsW [Corallococcus sp.]MCM1359278.1 putative lipid II flippase FtsW [Corallococcus sp.]MCM1394670.1 putative lipid II flippase FtsW [Corallococcus sp.]